MALVLCDGSASSLKAIDFALQPQLLLQHYDREQLVLLHGWRPSQILAAAASNTGDASNSGGGGSPASFVTPLQLVINTALEQLGKSKIAKDVVNYKIEMLRLPNGGAVAAAATTATNGTAIPQLAVSGAAGARVSTPQQPQSAGGLLAASPSGVAALTPHGRGGVSARGTRGAPAAAATEEASVTFAIGGGEEASANVIPNPALNLPPNPAAALATYAVLRAKHHGCATILLGVGNHVAGKLTAVGSVAREALAQQLHSSDAEHDGALSFSFNLWFIKSSGANAKPNAPMRLLVLADADAVGVQAERQEAALRYALSLASAARGDRVGLLVVTNNGTGSRRAAAATTAKSGEYDDAAVIAPTEQIAAMMQRIRDSGVDDDEDATRPVGDDDGAATAVTGGALAAAAAAAAAAASAPPPLPLFAPLVLEPTKEKPQPVANDVPAQVAKAVAAIKPDFLVLPPQVAVGGGEPLVGDALMTQLLGIPRPHIILPRWRKAM